MPSPRPQPDEHLAILERRKKVAARYIRGETQWEIARAFEVTQATVSNDLKAIRAAWLAEAVRDMDEIKARELAKVDACEEQAWKAWTRSQEDAETLRAKMRGDTAETEKIKKGQAGDPRFLDLVLKCVEKRCLILGVYDQAFEQRLAEIRGLIEALERGEGSSSPVGGTGSPDETVSGGPGGPADQGATGDTPAEPG